jgi:hypothetical protein
MPITTENEPVVNDEVWRAWVQKGKQREKAQVRRVKETVEIAAALLVVGGAVYFLIVK